VHYHRLLLLHLLLKIMLLLVVVAVLPPRPRPHQHRLWWYDLVNLVLIDLAAGVEGVGADHLGGMWLISNRERQPGAATHTPAYPGAQHSTGVHATRYQNQDCSTDTGWMPKLPRSACVLTNTGGQG
jgi:hypothetical protein